MKRIYPLMAAIAFAAGGVSAAGAPSTQPAGRAGQSAIDAAHLQLAKQDIEEGIQYFLRTQNPDGGWGPQESHPAMTALALKALLQHPGYDASSPPVAKGLALLLKSAQPDGGIYDPQAGQANYTTSVAMMALVAAKDQAYKPAIDKAVAYLKGIQIVEGDVTPQGRKVTKEYSGFGGTTYGEHGRPDLSNLSFTAEALHEAGVPPTDPFFANAVVFLSRVQNRSESNDQPWAAVANDGGFVYAPIGESKAGEDEIELDGRRGLRSYGSMTYAGFKSMLYANVSRDDPRVQAAYRWIRRYWRLDSNPNMPHAQSRQGLYYYYHVFARALRAWGQDVITDSQGAGHNWRRELIDALHARQQADGSWVNPEPRWFENVPQLTTAYAVLALQEATK